MAKNLLVVLFVLSALPAWSQTTSLPKKTATTRPVALPEDMDCDKLKGDSEATPVGGATVVKRGADYYLCRPKSSSLLARAKTAAIVVHSTQTISCGDGSSDNCIREDSRTERQIEELANKTQLWRYFDSATPSKADLILQFVANERVSSSAQIVLSVQDSDSGDWPYREARSLTDIENDVNRLIEHFIAKSGRTPTKSKEELEREQQCALILGQLASLKSSYQKKRSDYEFKNSHTLDAQMEECNLHWRDWVCLKRGGTENGVSYARQWNESGEELQRKLALEYEELKTMEQQIDIQSKSGCSAK
jgi:hypothetical protein